MLEIDSFIIQTMSLTPMNAPVKHVTVIKHVINGINFSMGLESQLLCLVISISHFLLRGPLPRSFVCAHGETEFKALTQAKLQVKVLCTLTLDVLSLTPLSS